VLAGQFHPELNASLTLEKIWTPLSAAGRLGSPAAAAAARASLAAGNDTDSRPMLQVRRWQPAERWVMAFCAMLLHPGMQCCVHACVCAYARAYVHALCICKQQIPFCFLQQPPPGHPALPASWSWGEPITAAAAAAAASPQRHPSTQLHPTAQLHCWCCERHCSRCCHPAIAITAKASAAPGGQRSCLPWQQSETQ
jgi:hypothetical protein